MLLFDFATVPVALYLAFALRFGTATPFEQLAASWPLPLILTILGPLFALALRLPWIKLAALDSTAMGRIGAFAVAMALAAIVASYLMTLNAPRSVPAIFMVTLFSVSILGRYLGQVLVYRPWGSHRGTPVAIYGAGAAGIQLASALRNSAEVRPVFFVDDNRSLHGLIISGLKVVPAAHLESLSREGLVDRVLLAMPSQPQAKQDAIVGKLHDLGIEVQVLPSYVDLIAGKAHELKTVSPDALLGRDKVDLDIPEIAKTYAGRTVMVTGAGGSIGSELCRQLLDCRPAEIVLFEQSEYALYEIDREMRPKAAKLGIMLTTRLGSVTNPPRVAAVIAEEEVDIILHAAAYKHVPIVEDNELEGARNNILGTQIVAEAARAANVERFILVSTDKAVRPTNIMGASKRMAELVIQDLQTRSAGARFAMVRFGNVLGSSGSVLPLFEKQIRAGGPVTVTHEDVTRFFMTIPEAARLVLLAGSYAEGGDVFVLDMGKPMKIMDIAKRMIEMSGASVQSPDAPHGIPIEVTGLRPGEKLYEELLIDDDSLVATPHAKILRAEETRLSEIEVAAMLKDVRRAVADGDAQAIRRTVQAYVHGYHRQEAQA
ncbi:MAG: nucleoside-diphosphate sugar epimerase/dehydratase [Pseudomonadota bacterium]